MKRNPFRLDDLCMRCFKIRKEDENFYGFALEDDRGQEMIFKGHEECVEAIREDIQKSEDFARINKSGEKW